MNNNILFETALAKGRASKRIMRDEALCLANAATPDQLFALGAAAGANREIRFGGRTTFVRNIHLNPSNVCEMGCRFCHYSVRPGNQKAYFLTAGEILEKVKAERPNEVHIVGGVNKKWGYAKYLELVRSVRILFPHMFIKGFTPIEIDSFAHSTRSSSVEVLKSFKDAGLNSLTGGGAEQFSHRIRQQYCPGKLPSSEWLRIHDEAASMGLGSNATMLFGIREKPEEVVDHMLTLREAQDSMKSFQCFIPLAYQPGKSVSLDEKVSPLTSLKIIALARLVLDNFPHIKAYWPMIGLETAATALSWGADDIDGTLGEEKIAHAGAAQTPKALSVAQIEETIVLGGFSPIERDGWFVPLNQQIAKAV